MKLIYCSYSNYAYSSTPEWITKLQNHTKFKETGNILYDPYGELPKVQDTSILDALPINELLASNIPILKLKEEAIKAEAGKELYGLKFSDPVTSMFLFREDYFLLRSSLYLMDLSTPSFGECFRSFFLASIGRVPIVGMSNRFSISPQIHENIQIMCNPKNTDFLVDVILRML